MAMTDQLRQMVQRVERLTPEEQDAIAEALRHELDERDAERRRRTGRQVLARAAAFRSKLRQAGYPPVDAVAIARTAREELERRPE